jgi:hypothetical protein
MQNDRLTSLDVGNATMPKSQAILWVLNELNGIK